MGTSGADEVQSVAFWLTLSAIFFPVVQKAYDGIVVNLIVNCCRKKFSCAAACATVSALMCAIPAMLKKVLGLAKALLLLTQVTKII